MKVNPVKVIAFFLILHIHFATIFLIQAKGRTITQCECKVSVHDGRNRHIFGYFFRFLYIYLSKQAMLSFLLG